MNKVTWTGFGFDELEKEFETAEELIKFMCEDSIKPYVTKVVIGGIELKRD